MNNTPRTAIRAARLSSHAIDRWRERVDPQATVIEARLALAQLISRGQIRSTPRHWTDVNPAPGLRFAYWSERPSVCALIVDGVVVTVLTRGVCRSTAPHSRAALRAVGADPARRPRRMQPASPWRWDGRLDAA
jgi:hypothetical protein